MNAQENGNPVPALETQVFIPFSPHRIETPLIEEIFEIARKLDIDRLRNIKQLGIKFVEPESPFASPHSTRYDHSILAAFYAGEIGRNIGLPESEVKKIIAVTLLHDRGTPALGDGTKYMDPDRLNEEDFWDEDLPEKSWEYLFSLGLNREEITKIIHNEGLLGSILDIADRVSYVLGDLHQLNRPPLHPQLGDIYKDVRLDDSGQLYFDNASRLRNFLWERAELFNRFYIDPRSQSIDLLLPSLIAPLYDPHDQDESKLSPKKLRQLTDIELVSLLSNHYGINPKDFLEESFWNVNYAHYSNFDEALNALDRAQEDPGLKALGIKKRNGFNPSTDFKGWDKLSGKPIPAKELFPYTYAPYIQGLVEETTGFLVVYSGVNTTGAARLITTPRIF